MKEYFKDLPDGSDFFNAPRGEDGWVVEVKEGDDMRQLFAKIKDLAYGVSGNEFEGSSWKLHKAAEALSDLWETAHAMSYFRVLSMYDSISDLRQKFLFFTRSGFGKRLYLSNSYILLILKPVSLDVSATSKTSCPSIFIVIFISQNHFNIHDSYINDLLNYQYKNYVYKNNVNRC